MARYFISGFTDEYNLDFDIQLEGAKKNHLKYIELRFIDGINISLLTDAQLETVREKLQKNGIKGSAVASPLGKITIENDFEAHLKTAERIYRIANYLDIPFVRIFSFYVSQRQRGESFRQEVLKRLEMLISLADKYNVQLCLENEEGIFGDSPEACKDLLDYFGGRLRFVFDMGNFVIGKFEAYPHAYFLLKPYIAYFHIKDAVSDGTVVPIGEGEGHIGDILNDYKKGMKCDTFVSLEPHLVDFSGLSSLTHTKLKQAKRFSSGEEAFDDSVRMLRKILHEEL